MRNILFLLISASVFLVHGQDSSYSAGNKAYESGDFTGAIEHYNQLVGAEKMSSELYYNLGNAYYQTQELGEAIWAYEKALKLNPKNEHASYNLAFANKNTKDIVDPSGSEIKQWLIANTYGFGINFWSILSILFSVLLAGLIYLFFVTGNKKTKNLALTTGFIGLALFTLSLIFSFYHKSFITSQNEGIIIKDIVNVRTTPSAESTVAFELHEGTKISLLRRQNEWVEINLNKNTGWLKQSELWGI